MMPKFRIKFNILRKFIWPSVWPDWAIYWTLGNFLKPLATINLPKSPTVLGNLSKGVKIFHSSSEIIFGQLSIDNWQFYSGHTADVYLHFFSLFSALPKILTSKFVSTRTDLGNSERKVPGDKSCKHVFKYWVEICCIKMPISGEPPFQSSHSICTPLWPHTLETWCMPKRRKDGILQTSKCPI